MAIHNVGDAGDREQWLATRKNYLTASSIFTWRGVDIPTWWGDTRAAIIAEKLEGTEKEFDHESRVAMNHGSFDEGNIARKLGEALGCPVETTNVMMVNDRWPNIAATLDGFLHPCKVAPGPEYCQEEGYMEAIRQRLLDIDDTCVLEIKKSVSTVWQRKVPDYYISQVQCQLHVTDKNYGVIVAETIKRAGRRQFWDLRPYLIERSDVWGSYLDKANEQFQRLVLDRRA